MSDKDLLPHERRIVEKVRAMIAGRHGKMQVVVHEGNLDVLGGPSERFKIPVDKTNIRG